MATYNLKDKIEVTDEFLAELISKSWQETEALQNQITNIDTSTKLGAEVARLLKNTCTSYYVLVGCLESLAENADIVDTQPDTVNIPEVVEAPVEELSIEPDDLVLQTTDMAQTDDFEPFEYFVDFDEPTGEPISDEDLYNN